MTEPTPQPQITVLDAGGQYCHLIARRVREFGIYADVCPSDTPAAALAGRRGIIVSGGPSSVYDPGSPSMDTAILASPAAVLGICYGQQLMAHLLDGAVRPGERGEYGLARLEIESPSALFDGLEPHQQVWMSHRDVVEAVPSGFSVLARTETCAVAAMADPARRLYAVQFHPEVVHTRRGREILSNFLFRVCGCEKDWDPRARIPLIERSIREAAGGRKVFFFVSGGVDSAVAYTLCRRALGEGRVQGAYVDTGLMREAETESVERAFPALGIVREQDAFLGALAGVSDPERKRLIIGEMFVDVQERILQSGRYLEEDWILGQGTIYPDTIESGGTAQADLIKTHHNRVAGIRRLIEANRVVEPLRSLYKDEVRAVGRELGLPGEILDRHPFPGPGLAIRCLCSETTAGLERLEDGWLIPVRSVGVQGDSRSYRAALLLDDPATDEDPRERATTIINRLTSINRVVAMLRSHARPEQMQVSPGGLTPDRLDRLRRADAIVRRLSHEHGFDGKVWQFPVVLIPLGRPGQPDSVVLRPVDSVDGMTAQAVMIEAPLADRICSELLEVDGVCAVLHDLTHKPPATIEWE